MPNLNQAKLDSDQIKALTVLANFKAKRKQSEFVFLGLPLYSIAFGGLSVGLFLALGGAAIGTIALGGGALGVVALGGAAAGYYAAGGAAYGACALAAMHQSREAIEFFSQWNFLHWLGVRELRR